MRSLAGYNSLLEEMTVSNGNEGSKEHSREIGLHLMVVRQSGIRTARRNGHVLETGAQGANR